MVPNIWFHPLRWFLERCLIFSGMGLWLRFWLSTFISHCVIVSLCCWWKSHMYQKIHQIHILDNINRKSHLMLYPDYIVQWFGIVLSFLKILQDLWNDGGSVLCHCIFSGHFFQHVFFSCSVFSTCFQHFFPVNPFFQDVLFIVFLIIFKYIIVLKSTYQITY
jgi:hypothetical protein